jgi:hypothetical protein
MTAEVLRFRRLAHDARVAPKAGTHSAQCLSSADQMPHLKPTRFRRITMQTLTIKDLARTEELDRTAMAAVRGGWKMGTPTYSFGDMQSQSHSPTPTSSSFDSSLHATQSLVQMQDVINATANGSAFLDGIHVDNHVSQNGTNKIIRK